MSWPHDIDRNRIPAPRNTWVAPKGAGGLGHVERPLMVQVQIEALFQDHLMVALPIKALSKPEALLDNPNVVKFGQATERLRACFHTLVSGTLDKSASTKFLTVQMVREMKAVNMLAQEIICADLVDRSGEPIIGGDMLEDKYPTDEPTLRRKVSAIETALNTIAERGSEGFSR